VGQVADPCVGLLALRTLPAAAAASGRTGRRGWGLLACAIRALPAARELWRLAAFCQGGTEEVGKRKERMGTAKCTQD